jgi:hypothetical protein
MLADKLQMSSSEAERWIVNLIRNAKLDAKLDSQANLVVMSMSHPSVYQKIIEKTKGLSFRSSVLANNLAKVQQGRFAATPAHPVRPPSLPFLWLKFVSDLFSSFFFFLQQLKGEEEQEEAAPAHVEN